jgi:acyl-coenzyme A thioesterase PaaI-like protein
MASLPDGAVGFATSTITSHHLTSADVGDELIAEATMLHGGRSTQVWDVTVRRRSDNRPIATLRNVQQLLYPR